MRSRPLGITILALVLAIGGVFSVLSGTEALGITKFGLGAAVANAAGMSGAASIVSGVLSLIVAAGMFTLAGWAYTLTTVVLVIRILADLWAVVTHGASSALGSAAIGNLVVSLIGLWYFRREAVKSAFGK